MRHQSRWDWGHGVWAIRARPIALRHGFNPNVLKEIPISILQQVGGRNAQVNRLPPNPSRDDAARDAEDAFFDHIRLK
jgi:hypothetical protein